MSTYSKVDPGTLGWVKSEIDETLSQARLALEAFVENTADKTNLRFCITHLHQVVGTLLMVELDNAAMLAKETEALAEGILTKRWRAAPRSSRHSRAASWCYRTRSPGCNSASRTRRCAMSRCSMTCAPRAARRRFQNSICSPPTSRCVRRRRVSATTPGREEAERCRERAPSGWRMRRSSIFTKQQRTTFQPLLLGWLRDANQRQPLRDIAVILERLQLRTGLPTVEQLFWVARGLLEGLAEDGLASTVERKKLLSRLDQLIKKLIDGADKSQVRTGAETLTRAMLWKWRMPLPAARW